MYNVNKKAFTLIEIMVVIAIIGILTMIGLNFDYTKNQTVEKRDRIVNKVFSIINTEKLNLKIGKGVVTVSSGIINPSYAKISISTGGLAVTYYNGPDIDHLTIAGTGETFKAPFYGETHYNIKSLSYYNSSLSTTGTLTNIDIFLSGDSTTMSGTDVSGTPVFSDNIVGLSIQAGYDNNYKTIDFDRRTGKVSYNSSDLALAQAPSGPGVSGSCHLPQPSGSTVASTIPGTPSMPDTQRQSVSGTPCYVSCVGGYIRNGSICTLDTTCSGTLNSSSQSGTSTSYNPTTSRTYNISGGECTFECKSGYFRDTTSSTCISSQCGAQTISVSTHDYSLPATSGGSYYTGTFSSGITNGTITYNKSWICNGGSFSGTTEEIPNIQCTTSNLFTPNLSTLTCQSVGCSTSSMTVGLHQYNSIPSTNSGATTTPVASNPISIPNGTITYSGTFRCNTPDFTFLSESGPYPNCDTAFPIYDLLTNSCLNNTPGVCDTTTDLQTLTTKPTTNFLCTSGSPTTVQSIVGGRNWQCIGGNGENASCSAIQSAQIDGQCGSADGGSFSVYPTSGLCNTPGTVINVDTIGADLTYNWTCPGSGTSTGISVDCSATKSASFNGICGSADGGVFSSYPTSGLCNSPGTVTDLDTTGTDGSFNWTCNGNGAGFTDANCSAIKGTTVNGACSPLSNGQALLDTPSVTCLSGDSTVPVYTEGVGRTRQCNGSGIPNGTNVSCSSTELVRAFTGTIYPGCDTNDIVQAGKVWASCNIGAGEAGFGSGSYGSLFLWGVNHSGSSLIAGDLQTLNAWGGATSNDFKTLSYADRTKMKGPCATGYHVPTSIDFTNVNSFTRIKELYLPLAGVTSKDIVDRQGDGYMGSYWYSNPTGTSSTGQVLTESLEFNSSVFNPTYAGSTDDVFSIRCIRDDTINGSCGVVGGTYQTSAPSTSDLCADGYPAIVTTTVGGWNRSCPGAGHPDLIGTTANCVAYKKQIVTCGGTIPANATATTVATYDQTWNGSSWVPTTTNWGENQTTCDFNCNYNYNWNSGTNTCVPATKTFTCSAKPTTGTSWNTVASYTQTRNGSTRTPASSTTSYNTTSSTTSCIYTCSSGYVRNGSSCAIVTPTVVGTCTNISSKAICDSRLSTHSIAPLDTCIRLGSSLNPMGSFALYDGSLTNGYKICYTSVRICDNTNLYVHDALNYRTFDYSTNPTICDYKAGEYTYSWSPNDTTTGWSTCNAACGPGTQIRTVSCKRNDGIFVDDSYCTGVKPIESQSCNLGACIVTSRYPGCNADDITLSNGQIWSACNIGSSVAGTGPLSYGNYYSYNQSLTVCASGYHEPSQTDWKSAYDIYPNQIIGNVNNLANKLMIPLAGYIYAGSSQGSLGIIGNCWSSTPYNSANAYALSSNSTYLSTIGYSGLTFQLSVRCIKN